MVWFVARVRHSRLNVLQEGIEFPVIFRHSSIFWVEEGLAKLSLSRLQEGMEGRGSFGDWIKKQISWLFVFAKSAQRSRARPDRGPREKEDIVSRHGLLKMTK